MESRKNIAVETKSKGTHNCTQSILCTYCDLTNIDEDTIYHIGNGCAAGMGNMEGTCGAIVGASIILGLTIKDRAKAMKATAEIMKKFDARNGATQCKLLKGVGTGVPLRSCADCVADAAEFLEQALDANK